MKDFAYMRASTIDEARNWLCKYGEDAKILAGGQSLVYLLKQQLIDPEYVIDIKGIADWNYVREDEGGGLRIGATASHRSLEQSPLVRDKYNVLAEMERTVASVAIRNWGTVCGAVAHADPSSDVVPTLMALDAELTLLGPDGTRVVPIGEFCVGLFTTTLQPGELLSEIRIPDCADSGSYYYKFAQRANDSAIAGVAARVQRSPTSSRRCKDVRIVIGSVGAMPERASRAEALLRGQELSEEAIEAAAVAASEDCEPTATIKGSVEYQRDIVRVLVERSIKNAAART